jgi:hypothetical protein
VSCPSHGTSKVLNPVITETEEQLAKENDKGP